MGFDPARLGFWRVYLTSHTGEPRQPRGTVNGVTQGHCGDAVRGRSVGAHPSERLRTFRAGSRAGGLPRWSGQRAASHLGGRRDPRQRDGRALDRSGSVAERASDNDRGRLRPGPQSRRFRTWDPAERGSGRPQPKLPVSVHEPWCARRPAVLGDRAVVRTGVAGDGRADRSGASDGFGVVPSTVGVVDESGGSVLVERRFATILGLRLARMQRYNGSVVSWENTTYPGTTAFVVQLPSRLSASLETKVMRALLCWGR